MSEHDIRDIRAYRASHWYKIIDCYVNLNYVSIVGVIDHVHAVDCEYQFMGSFYFGGSK